MKQNSPKNSSVQNTTHPVELVFWMTLGGLPDPQKGHSYSGASACSRTFTTRGASGKSKCREADSHSAMPERQTLS